MRRLLPLAVVMGCSGPVDLPPEPDPNVVVMTKTVTARQPAPNVMLLLDRSAAMALPLQPARFGETRFNDVQFRLGELIAAGTGTIRFGLSVFPGAAGCETGVQLLPAGSDPKQVDGWIRALPTFGQSPIAATLTALSGFESDQREDFVLLVTASEPGCGGDAVAAVRALRERRVRTIVVGYGPDVVSSPALQAMAVVGGFQRTCPQGTDAECGAGDRCDTTSMICGTAYYAAPTGDALSAVLASFTAGLQGDSVCRYTLEKVPSSPDRLSVFVDGARLEMGSDTWLLSGGQVEFYGAACDRLKSSTADWPVTVELRVDLRP